MKKSPIFYTSKYQEIEDKIKNFLNAQPDFLSFATIESTRATGDAIQEILSMNFQEIIGEELIKNYQADFARRSMADFAFFDKEDFYYVVDVKTHRLETEFNMPNLTSVERLCRFYEDDKNYFVILLVGYKVMVSSSIRVEKVYFTPIEFLSWNCLTIGALGWGQIQIANANIININPQYSRKKWMLELCNILLDKFYPLEKEKINTRIKYFEKIKKDWEAKSDIWE